MKKERRLKTYSGGLADDGASNDVKEWAMHSFLCLGGAVAELGVELLRDGLVDLTVLLRANISELGVVRAGCPLVASGIMRCVG